MRLFLLIILVLIMTILYSKSRPNENFLLLSDPDVEACFSKKAINTMDYKYSKKVKFGEAVCYLTPTQYTNNIPVISWNGYYLNNLCVKPNYRRKGHSKRLLEKILNDAKNEGRDHIILMVNRDNNGARVLYENMGFREYQSDSKHIIMVKNIV